jgi:hypothetical protein
VLEPFYNAVKSVDPTAQVIGGTVVGMELSYWQGIAAAGGFRYMDIAAIHPYTGHNRGFEEHGIRRPRTPAARADGRQRRRVDAGLDHRDRLVVDGGGGLTSTRATGSLRAELWMHALGIPVMEYLDYQGNWTTNGLDYSLINADTVVKPAALAAMVEAKQTAGRSFAGWLQTGMPLTYAAQFGASGGTTMVALWTDDTALRAVIHLAQGSDPDATLVNEYGATRSVSLARGLDVTLDGAVQYLVLPAGDSVSVASPEAFGPTWRWPPTDRQRAPARARGEPGEQRDRRRRRTAGNVGDLAGEPSWGSAYGDASPELTVTFPQAERIDRVLLATSSVGSTMPGIRSWNVLAESPERPVAAGRLL